MNWHCHLSAATLGKAGPAPCPSSSVETTLLVEVNLPGGHESRGADIPFSLSFAGTGEGKVPSPFVLCTCGKKQNCPQGHQNGRASPTLHQLQHMGDLSLQSAGEYTRSDLVGGVQVSRSPGHESRRAAPVCSLI